jgi:ribose transport system permease protein
MVKKFNLQGIVPYLGLTAIVIIFTILSGGNLISGNNILVIFQSMFIYTIAALGTSFVFAIGCLDFSLGSLVGVTATAGAILAQSTENIVICIVVAMIIGTASGIFIATLHVLLGLNPFIVSVTVMFIFRGLTWVLNNDGSTKFPLSMYGLDNMTFKIIALLAVFIFIFILFKLTKFGRCAKAIGSNEVSARQSGIAIGKVKIMAFALSGMFGGLAGILSLIKAGSSYTTTGQMFECDVLIALVLGGMPLDGGTNAKLRCAIIGSLSLAILCNGLVLCGTSAELQQGVKGLILIIIVALSYNRSNASVIG